jgi:hypothetical protein
MIAEILSFVPEHHSVSMTCKKFHEISCDTKFFKLQLFTNSLELHTNYGFTRFIDTFQFLMRSNRRFNRLFIRDSRNKSSALHYERLGQVLQQFGKDIKQADIGAIEFPPNIVDLLNLMPNLEKIDLVEIGIHENTIIKEGELKLHKLKQFSSSDCGLKVLQIFNQLPPGVLQEITLNRFWHEKSTSAEVSIDVPKLFNNQHSIKRVGIPSECIEFLDWSQMKLKSLKIYSNTKKDNKKLVEKVLEGQDEMKELHFNGDPSILNPIIKELKSLVKLEIETRNLSTIGLPELSKLSKLKSLEFECYNNNNPADIISFLNFTRNSGVEKLEVYCRLGFPEFTISQINVNFPSVKELTLQSKSSINVVNTILQSFPNLEILHFDPDRVANEAYIYQEDLKHQKLKKLCIGPWNGEINHDFAKLIGCCTKLEEFSAESALTKGTLKEIFTLQPNLKSFEISNYVYYLESRDFFKNHVTQDDIAAVKENGKKLETFALDFCFFEDGISPENLQEKFNDQFDTIEVKFNSYNSIYLWGVKFDSYNSTYLWEMKKTSKHP